MSKIFRWILDDIISMSDADFRNCIQQIEKEKADASQARKDQINEVITILKRWRTRYAGISSLPLA